MFNYRKIIITGICILLGIGFFYFLFGENESIIKAIGKNNEQIAIIEIEGPIVSSSHILKLFRHYSEMDSVKALVLRINSPGGQVGSSQEIYAELKKLRKKGKKVVASFGDVAASGGYYIACGADKIVSNPGTLTGSIGVIMEFANFEELIKKVGVDIQVVKSGLHKDIGSPVRKLTEEEQKILKGVVDDVYDQFVEAVSESRKLDKEEVKKYADGRIFSGRQAKEYGLVDQLGDIEDAIDLAKTLANISGVPKIIIQKKPLPAFLDYLSSIFYGKIDSYKSNSLSLSYRL
ncbi:MAG: signal peptide peptidase SppA [bacterium]|nr:signal peptide peptidase SppA [bacterium]